MTTHVFKSNIVPKNEPNMSYFGLTEYITEIRAFDGVVIIRNKILGRRLGYFKSCFPNVIEKGSIVVFTIPVFSIDVLRRIVIYFISGKLSVKEEHLDKMLKFADEHRIPEIVKFCIQYMEKTLNEKNMWDYLKLASTKHDIIVNFNKNFNYQDFTKLMMWTKNALY